MRGEGNLFKKFLPWSPFMFFRKFGQKHKGGPRQFFQVFKKISKITLIPCFRACRREKFCWKTLIFKRKTLRNFRFSVKILLKSLVNAKTSAASEIFLKNAYLYAENDQKMTNFCLKNVKFGDFLLKKWEICVEKIWNFGHFLSKLFQKIFSIFEQKSNFWATILRKFSIFK